jgi:hypothetical protein
MEKEAGYDEWFHTKISRTLASVKAGESKISEHDVVMDRVWQDALAKTHSISA